MAVLDTLDTLAPIREKVEAGERLDFEDGLALMESDDLLALGELADLARRLRGGGDEVYFVQRPSRSTGARGSPRSTASTARTRTSTSSSTRTCCAS